MQANSSDVSPSHNTFKHKPKSAVTTRQLCLCQLFEESHTQDDVSEKTFKSFGHELPRLKYLWIIHPSICLQASV